MKKQIAPYRQIFSSYTLVFLIAYVAGILIGEFCYDFLRNATIWFIIGIALLAAICPLMVQRFQKRASLGLAYGVGIAWMFLGIAMLVDQRNEQDISWCNTVKTHRMTIEDTPIEREKTWQFTARVLAPGEGYGKLVHCNLGKYTEIEDETRLNNNLTLRPGDEILLHGEIVSPHNTGNPDEFDYATYLRHQGVSGMIFCYANQWQNEGESKDMPLKVRALRFRNHLVERCKQYFSGKELSVFTAITLGDKSRISRDVRNTYSQSGASHVLALSGLHLGILFGLWLAFIKRLNHQRRLLIMAMRIIGLIGLFAFMFIAGFPKSLVRAGLMFALVQMQRQFEGDVYSVNNLALAALIITLLSPQAVFDVGFQLSCVSVLGILLYANHLLSPKTLINHRLLRWLAGLFVVSFVAQLATLPLVAYYFHAIPIYGLLTNFIAVPAAYILLTLGMAFFLLPFMQPVLAWILKPTLMGLNAALSYISQLPGSVVHFRPTLLTVAIIYVILILQYRVWRYGIKHIRWRYVRTSFILLCIAMVTEMADIWLLRLKPQIVFYSSYGTTPIHFIQSSNHSYLWNPSNKDGISNDKLIFQLEENFWQRHHIKPPIVAQKELSEEDCYIHDEIAMFGDKKIARINSNKRTSHLKEPLNIDFLLIERGSKSPLTIILQYYRPKLIVLSSSLSEYVRNKYEREARHYHLKTYDMSKEGALQIPL